MELIGPGRKTEEGFLIYKEAELKIDPEAGGESSLVTRQKPAKLESQGHRCAHSIASAATDPSTIPPRNMASLIVYELGVKYCYTMGINNTISANPSTTASSSPGAPRPSDSSS
jgi:hypothetical protein